MTPDAQAFEQLGRWVLKEHRGECADVDGGSIQEKAEALGLLVRVPVDEPCGDTCWCAEYGDFPQVCLRLKPGVTL